DERSAEALDLVVRDLAKVLVERVARLKLLAVDEEGVRTREWIAVLVEVLEELEASLVERRRSIVVGTDEAGDEVVYELRDGRVLTNDDEARGNPKPRFLPELERLLVVPVKGLERGL